jgi:hypothetical integral membrane protein (TIGR02206 family)
MSEYFALYYTGTPFRLFSPSHLIAIMVVLAINVLLVLLIRWNKRPKLTEWIRYGLVALCILDLVAWQLWQVAVGVWSLAADSLPLHLCSIVTILAVPLLIGKSYRLYELLYFWALAGSGHGLLTPDLQIYGFPHFRFFEFFLGHGVNITVVVFMTAAHHYRPHWRSIGRMFVITNGYLLLIGLMNGLTGSNYLYIARKPEFPTLLDYLGQWPWYILGLEMIGVASCLLCYLPCMIYDWLVPPMRASLNGSARPR